MTSTLGCILAVRDRLPEVLERTFQTYTYQTFSAADRVLVDYGSEASAAEAYLTLCNRFGWRLISAGPKPEWNLSDAYNLAAAALRPVDVIFKSDADVLLGPDVLERAARHGRKRLCIFTCLATAEDVTYPPAFARSEDLWAWVDGLEALEPMTTEGFHACPRNWFTDVGGYDLEFRGWGFEDSDLRERAKATIGVMTESGGLLVHQWHPRSVSAAAAARNEAYYRKMAVVGKVKRNTKAAYAPETSDPSAPPACPAPTPTGPGTARVAVATRSINDRLCDLSDSLLGLDAPGGTWPPGTHRYRLTATDGMGYFRRLLELEADWVVNLDEDAFVLDPGGILRLIEHMDSKGFAACGMPDGGVVPIRRHNPVVCNAFFNVFDLRRVRRCWADWQGVVGARHRPEYEAPAPGFARRSMFEFDHFEKYYGAFFAILEAGERVLYLDAEEWRDGVSTLLFDPERRPLVLHTWYSRHWESSYHTRTRILKAYSFAREANGLPPMSLGDPAATASDGQSAAESNSIESHHRQSLVPESAKSVLFIDAVPPGFEHLVATQPRAAVTVIDRADRPDPAAFRGPIRWVKADVETHEPVFGSETFDCVVLAGALARVREPYRLLRRVREWLAPNGVLVAIVPNVRHRVVVESLLDGRWEPQRRDGQAIRFFTRRELEKLLFRSGFAIPQICPLFVSADRPSVGAGASGTIHFGALSVEGISAAEASEFAAEQLCARARVSQRPDFGLTSIVIVAHNQLDATRACVDSIALRTDEPYELIFVDNASEDGTQSYLETLAGATVICNPENLGFPAAANQGIRAAKGRQVLLLNNDTVVTTGWLSRMLDALYCASDVGLVGPCSNRVSGEQQIDVDYDEMASLDGFAWEWGKANAGIREDTDRLVGFCLLARKEVVDQVGLLDENFGLGCFEDDDYCRRCIVSGWRAVVARDAFVHHIGGCTFAASGVDFAALMRENSAKFDAKWKGSAQLPSATGIAAPAAPTSRKPDLSLCMIVRNNAGTIAAALESIRPWVDEMVVVDTGSTDETPAICARLGARVFHFPWVDDFSAARNESFRIASGRWLFWMDSDDSITPECGRRLRELASADADALTLGYVVRVRCPGPKAEDPVTVVDHIKLIRNDPRIRFEGRIHEQVLPSIRRLGGEVRWTDIFVTHTGYDHSPEGQSRKLERDLHLLHLELTERPGHPFTLFNLGMTYADVGRNEEAVGYLRQAIDASGPNDSQLRKAYALLVSALERAGRRADAWATCAEGLGLFPLDTELRFRQGLLFQADGRFTEAARAYEDILSRPDGQHFNSVVAGLDSYLTRHNLALVYESQGRFGKAEEQWRKIIDQAPGYAAAHEGLRLLVRRLGR